MRRCNGLERRASLASLLFGGVRLPLAVHSDLAPKVVNRHGIVGASIVAGNDIGVYADSCGLKTAFLGNGGRKAATIFSLRYSSSR